MFQPSHPPQKKKSHDKAVRSYILWLNLNKISEISVLQSADKEGNPSFHFHAPGSKRRYPCTQQHRDRLSQNITPVCSSSVSVSASDMYLESGSEKRAKNVDFHTAKNIQIQPTLFCVLFLDEFLETDLRPIFYSLTCSRVLQALLSDPAVDRNIPGELGMKPLHYCSAKDHAECAKVLVSHTAQNPASSHAPFCWALNEVEDT